MKFMDRMIRVDSAYSALPIDNIEDPAALTKVLCDTRGETRERKYKYPRISQIGDICVREWVLGMSVDTQKSEYIPFALKIIFGIGSSLHSYYQNSKDLFPNMEGRWECYDDKTEVLTESGFKHFKDVKLSDKIATLNPDTEYLEYNYPIQKQVYPYEGDMLELSKSRLISLSVTPCHNMYVCKHPRSKNKKFEFCEAAKLEDAYEFQLKKNCLWEGQLFPAKLPGIGEIPMSDYLEFMAKWLSDGYVTSSRKKDGSINGYRIYFCKQKTNKRKKIEFLLRRLKINFYKTDKGFGFYNVKLYHYLEQFGHALDKFLPKELKNLPSSELRKFLSFYIEGDGTISGKRSCIYTSSKKMRDDIQEIIQKAGWSSSYRGDCREGVYSDKVGYIIQKNAPNFAITINKERLCPSLGKRNAGVSFKRIPYKGIVYDLTVPNHIMLIRRNGKIVWSGNCLGCGYKYPFGARPVGNCRGCGADNRAIKYSEHYFSLSEPFYITGKMDLFIPVGDPVRYRIGDIKGVADDKVEPRGNDIMQLATYLLAAKYDDSLPKNVDTTTGYLFYISKKMSYRAPVRTIKVILTPKLEEKITEILMQIKVGVDEDKIPKRRVNCKDKNCPFKAECAALGDRDAFKG